VADPHAERDVQALGPDAPPFVVNNVIENPNPGQICRRVEGTFQVPLYTTYAGAGSVLNIGLDGNPAQNGVINAPFTAIIPCSLSTAPASGPPIVYGHGLLGTGAGEVASSHLRTLAQTYGYVVVATDWQGMAAEDLSNILTITAAGLSDFRQLSERLHQGVLNTLVLAHLMKAADGLSSDPNFIYAGVPVIDPSEVFYYGNSQGGIFGGTFMALSTEVTRGVLGVPAANFSTLLQRSRDFNPYFALLRTAYPNDLYRMTIYPLIQQLWDKAEPNGWYHHTLSNPLPSTPVHKVLVHMATNDDEVSNVATEIMVRSMGIPQLTPVVKSYYNVAELAAPFDGSAMHESDEGDPAMPIGNIPPADNNAHGAMRGRPAIQAEIDQFLRTGGNVQNFCTGPCNPE
jgi:pimeloyl-ACP methyl ester carboxylesterase